MNGNLGILDETKTVISSLDNALRANLKRDCWEWEITSINYNGPTAKVRLFVPHEDVLAAGAVIANCSESWKYIYPLQFEMDDFSTKVIVTIREYS